LSLAQWKGRVVLVNLWATWCGPCRKEMPELAELQQRLGSEDFEVVAISVDRQGAEVARPFLESVGAEALKLYLDPSTKVLTDFKAVGLPASILIDRAGREVGRMFGPADWASPEALRLIEAAIAEGKTS
jgi:thiol-disulfide isomerase/thioredoxin